jgi:hypothetical protein
MSTIFSLSFFFFWNLAQMEKKKIKMEHSVTYSQIFEEKVTNVQIKDWIFSATTSTWILKGGKF